MNHRDTQQELYLPKRFKSSRIFLSQLSSVGALFSGRRAGENISVTRTDWGPNEKSERRAHRARGGLERDIASTAGRNSGWR